MIPEPLSPDDLESCELSIEVFGQDLVACIMSVKVKCRQKGLKQLLELIKQQQTLMDMEFIHASILMIQEAVTDSRESIFNQAIQNWKELHGKVLLHFASLFIHRFFSDKFIYRTHSQQ